jgi:ubiquitin-conjugating enzyme E2 G1
MPSRVRAARVTPRTRPRPNPPTPTHRPQVESIILSIISMLSSPNDESPANVDAAKQWREDREGFKKRVGRIVRKSQEML